MAPAELARLIRERKQAILTRWEQQVRTAGVARGLSRPALIDSMPRLIDELAHAAEPSGSEVEVGTTTIEHAQQRLELGYELGQLHAEYEALRLARAEELHACGEKGTLSDWIPLNRLIASSVADVTHRFARARERKLRALERISTDAIQADDLEQMLQRAIDVLSEVVPEVDEVTILLREGNALHVRASRGLQEEIARSFTLAIGEGFAGTIAATREPLLLHDAGHDPLVKSDVIRELGLRAMYGIPLLDGGEVVGVAHMGSRLAYDFQQEDMILFRSIANRVGAFIAARRVHERERAIDALRDRFIGMLAHDLRQPINAISTSVRVLLKGNLDTPGRRAAERIDRATGRMSRLVGDVLDFTRARLAGGIPLNVVPTDLAECVHGAIEECRLAHPDRTIEFRQQIHSPVFCDSDRIAQCIANLVGNALEHGDPAKPVDVSVTERGDDAIVSVHNEGAPIPAELLPHLFEPFRRGAGNGGSSGGLGLGLYIANAIVVAHGGGIEVRSDAAGGTRFNVRLPKRGPQGDG